MKQKHFIRPGIIAAATLGITILGIHACSKNDDWPCNEGRVKCLRVVEQSTGVPVVGAQVFLVQKTMNSVPQAAYNLVTDNYGNVEWDCSWAITDVCAEAGDGYWDACGSGYALNDDFLADGYYELRPKAFVRMNLIDTLPLNPELRVVAFSDYGDTYESEGLVPQGYYGHLGVVGGVNSILRVKRFANGDDFISSDMLEVQVPPGDTLELTYSY